MRITGFVIFLQGSSVSHLFQSASLWPPLCHSDDHPILEIREGLFYVQKKHGHFSVANSSQRPGPKMEIAIGTIGIHIDTVDTNRHLLRSRQFLQAKRAKRAKPKYPGFFRTSEVKVSNCRRRNSDPNNQQRILFKSDCLTNRCCDYKCSNSFHKHCPNVGMQALLGLPPHVTAHVKRVLRLYSNLQEKQHDSVV